MSYSRFGLVSMVVRLLCVCCALGVANSITLRPRRPHIIFFLADDYGWADVSYHGLEANGSNVIATPHLDKLASRGVKLEQYYVNPVCSPTRASIMSGRYTISHGIHKPLVDTSPSGLSLDEITLAQKLKEAGYATHMVGKWHLGFSTWAHTPQERGFDSFFGYYAGSQDYFSHESLCWAGSFKNGCFENTNKGTAVTGLDLHADRASVEWADGEYSTHLYTRKTEEVIRNHAALHHSDGMPLFIYVAQQAVHVANVPDGIHNYWTHQAPPEWIEKYSWVQDEMRRNLSAMVGVMDESASNITAALVKAGMWDDTIFIFSTDNGGPTTEASSNFPLRGGKASVWEGGVRGVGFVTGGNMSRIGVSVAGGYKNKQLMHVADWLPTLCHVAGCNLSRTLPLDGVSQWPSIAHNATTSRNEIVHELLPDDHQSVRLGDYKIVINQVGGPHKGASPQLFNVVDDPSEDHDLADALPEKLKELQARVHYWLQHVGPRHDIATPNELSDPRRHGGSWKPFLGENLDKVIV